MRVAFGYFKKHFLMTDAEVAARRQAVVDCAAALECELAALFVDEIDSAPQELHKALTTLMAQDDRALIVPNLLHFAAIGNPIEFRQTLENNHIEVLLSEAPGRTGSGQKTSTLLFPNTVLREARQRMPSPYDRAQCMSRAELAEAVCSWLWHTKGIQVPLDGHYIAKLERGAVLRAGVLYREALRAVLGVSTDRELGMNRRSPERGRS